MYDFSSVLPQGHVVRRLTKAEQRNRAHNNKIISVILLGVIVLIALFALVFGMKSGYSTSRSAGSRPTAGVSRQPKNPNIKTSTSNSSSTRSHSRDTYRHHGQTRSDINNPYTPTSIVINRNDTGAHHEATTDNRTDDVQHSDNSSASWRSDSRSGRGVRGRNVQNGSSDDETSRQPNEASHANHTNNANDTSVKINTGGSQTKAMSNVTDSSSSKGATNPRTDNSGHDNGPDLNSQPVFQFSDEMDTMR